jgi:hypothetical protein
MKAGPANWYGKGEKAEKAEYGRKYRLRKKLEKAIINDTNLHL